MKSLILFFSLLVQSQVFAQECPEMSMEIETRDVYCGDKLYQKWNPDINYWDPPRTSKSASSSSSAKPGRLENCQWTDDLPRMILESPNYCRDYKSTPTVKTCSGYVVCDSRDRDGNVFKQQRLSSCSEKNCAEDKAMECTQEAGYGSSPLEGVGSGVSDRVKGSVKAKQE